MTPYEIILNGLSKDADVAGGGRHMSNHFAKPEVGIQNVSSCTGNHTLHAVGVARAIKFYGGDEVAISSQGEASTSEGYVYEALNGASRERLPAVFVIQNNRFGISVPVTQQSANTRISDNYTGLKHLKIVNVDGTDFVDAYLGMQTALNTRSVAKDLRWFMPNASAWVLPPNSDRHELYRTAEEIEAAQALDPLARLRSQVIEAGFFTEEGLTDIEKREMKNTSRRMPLQLNKQQIRTHQPCPPS